MNEDMMTKNDSKELKVTGTFIFNSSVTRISKLNVLYLEQFYAE